MVETLRVQGAFGFTRIPVTVLIENIKRKCSNFEGLFQEVIDDAIKAGPLSEKEIQESIMMAVVLAKGTNNKTITEIKESEENIILKEN